MLRQDLRANIEVLDDAKVSTDALPQTASSAAFEVRCWPSGEEQGIHLSPHDQLYWILACDTPHARSIYIHYGQDYGWPCR